MESGVLWSAHKALCLTHQVILPGQMRQKGRLQWQAPHRRNAQRCHSVALAQEHCCDGRCTSICAESDTHGAQHDRFECMRVLSVGTPDPRLPPLPCCPALAPHLHHEHVVVQAVLDAGLWVGYAAPGAPQGEAGVLNPLDAAWYAALALPTEVADSIQYVAQGDADCRGNRGVPGSRG